MGFGTVTFTLSHFVPGHTEGNREGWGRERIGRKPGEECRQASVPQMSIYREWV